MTLGLLTRTARCHKGGRPPGPSPPSPATLSGTDTVYPALGPGSSMLFHWIHWGQGCTAFSLTSSRSLRLPAALASAHTPTLPPLFCAHPHPFPPRQSPHYCLAPPSRPGSCPHSRRIALSQPWCCPGACSRRTEATGPSPEKETSGETTSWRLCLARSLGRSGALCCTAARRLRVGRRGPHSPPSPAQRQTHAPGQQRHLVPV